jgi:eukaryotic-like serine/threonine-protein kinase
VDIQDSATVGCPVCNAGRTVSCLEVPDVPGYEVLDFLGEGGMSRVYKAKPIHSEGMVAIKVTKLNPERYSSAIARFRREYHVLSQLSHPNILRTFDEGEVDNLSFAVMEYVEGLDLRALVKDRGPLPADQACEYVKQACSALSYFHERNILHRDIKPANLLLTSGGIVKVIDLDLGKVVDRIIAEEIIRESTCADGHDSPVDDVTPPGAILGTLTFMAPERFAGRGTPRSDIYSLGGAFYYLLTSKLPFSATSAAEMLCLLQSCEPEPVERLRPDIPSAVAAIVRKMMAKRERDRYQTAAEVATALTAFSQGGTVQEGK